MGWPEAIATSAAAISMAAVTIVFIFAMMKTPSTPLREQRPYERMKWTVTVDPKVWTKKKEGAE